MRHIRADNTELECQVREDREPLLLSVPGVLIDGLAQPLIRRPDLCSKYLLIPNRQPGVRFAQLGRDPPSFATAFVTRRDTEHIPTVAVLRTGSPLAQPRRLVGSDDAPRTVYHGRVRDRAESGHR
jgi:hypothetical protein